MISEVPERVEDIQDNQPGINLGQRGRGGSHGEALCRVEFPWGF